MSSHPLAGAACRIGVAFALCATTNAFAGDDGAKLPWTADALREAALSLAAADAATSRDALFGDDGKAAPANESRESLFGEDVAPKRVTPPRTIAWRGFARGELAYTYADPEHWSKM